MRITLRFVPDCVLPVQVTRYLNMSHTTVGTRFLVQIVITRPTSFGLLPKIQYCFFKFCRGISLHGTERSIKVSRNSRLCHLGVTFAKFLRSYTVCLCNPARLLYEQTLPLFICSQTSREIISRRPLQVLVFRQGRFTRCKAKWEKPRRRNTTVTYGTRKDVNSVLLCSLRAQIHAPRGY